VLAAVLFQVAVRLFTWGVEKLPEPKNRVLRHALRGIAGSGSTAPKVVVSVGMALAMLVVVLVLEVNLRNEYLGASVFDAPTFVASDLFPDEVETLQKLRDDPANGITIFTATPMLRGSVKAINGTPTENLKTRGSEASFLLSGDVPMTYRATMPASS